MTMKVLSGWVNHEKLNNVDEMCTEGRNIFMLYHFKRRFFTESRIVCSKPIRSHGLICAFTRWRRVPFEGFLSAFYMGK